MTKCTNCMRGDCCGGDFDALKAENAELREAAQALYDSKFKDPKTGNQCVAFCELEKMAALLQEKGE